MPTALFIDANCLRKTDNKSTLAKELVSKVDRDCSDANHNVYVVDGGWLLHKVKWNAGCQFSDILQSYVNFIGRHFGEATVVVFDGYLSPTTKDYEHD